MSLLSRYVTAVCNGHGSMPDAPKDNLVDFAKSLQVPFQSRPQMPLCCTAQVDAHSFSVQVFYWRPESSQGCLCFEGGSGLQALYGVDYTGR